MSSSDVVATNNNTSSSPLGSSSPSAAAAEDPAAALSSDNDQHKDNMILSDDDDEEDEHDDVIKPWDEGGPSDCGYSESVHSTLMSVGATVNKVVGHPGESVSKVQHSIGNWFQELSYAARDIVRGENTADMHEDAADAVKTLISGGKTKDEQDDAHEDDREEPKSEAATSDEQAKENHQIGSGSATAPATGGPVDP